MTINHRLGSYEIRSILSDQMAEQIPVDAVILTDENVAHHYASWIGSRPVLILKAGEEHKNLAEYIKIQEWLATRPTPRSATIVALGGGVIGDLGGFVAASYMRGVRYIQVPTTLLAQVDSSIGGKVGVDLPQGKNLVGAFYPPHEVLLCTEALQTLDTMQFNNGMAEVWKYGFIMDQSLINQLAKEPLHANHPELVNVVQKCLAHKKHVVENDEFERNGLRATLNFGHTVGHAIEQLTNYTTYLHGEAISVGMVVEAKLGEILGMTPKGTHEEIGRLLAGSDLPIESETLARTDEMIASMLRDKKASSGKLAFSLLTGMGECKLVEDVPLKDVQAALNL